MERRPWEETHPSLLARAAGVAGIVFVALQFLPDSLGGPLFDEGLSTPRLLAWVRSSSPDLAVQGVVGALGMTLVALVLLALLAAARGRGLLRNVATVSVAVMLAVDWVHAGVYFALADAAHRAGSDAGLVALFSLTKTMTFADGAAFGLAVVTISLAALRSRALAAPLAWAGVLVGTLHVVALPVQVAITAGPDGITGPISVLAGLAWLLAVSAALLVRPITAGRQLSEPAPAVA